MAAQYLDYFASAPIDPRVLDVMIDVYRNNFGNADSRTHVWGSAAKSIVERGRKSISDILSIDKSEIIFTSGATESDNTAILGLQEYAESSGKKHIITTAIEHKAVLESIRHMEKHGFNVDYVVPDETGRVTAEAILSLVKPDTLLVSVMHINNETGIIQPVSEIGESLSKMEVLFHIDAAQSFGKLNSELRKTKYDMMSISGHKIHAPQGIGALILRRKNYKRPPISPLLYGGQQEYSFRPGTTPVALVAGFAKAAELMNLEYPVLQNQLLAEKRRILKSFEGLSYAINGDQRYALPNILNVSFSGVDSESVFTALKDHYAISNGSACTSGSYAPSYVLAAMGLTKARISEALRISWWKEPVDMTMLCQYVSDVALI